MANNDSYLGWTSDEKRPDFTTTAHHAAKWCAEVLRPSAMSKPGPRKQIKRTAYLDGLRGFAAFLVYWQHHQLWPLRGVPSNRILENGWGYEGQYYFAALPVIRTFFTGGHFAVAVFFVISGYVLSAKPITLIYAGEFTALGDNLGSALFRRWTRLHIPVILVTFFYMASWHAFGIWTIAPEHQPTFRTETWKWYAEIKNFSFVFRAGGDPWISYNFPVWSIPYEFRGSIVVYTCLLAFSRASRNARLWCQLGLIFYFTYVVDGWFCSMFVAGMLLCELDHLASINNLPTFFNKLRPWKSLIFYTLLLVSAFLSGVPSYVNDLKTLYEAPGWKHVAFLKPEAFWDQKWFFLFVSAVCLVSAIPRIPWLKSFFETPFNQYLGRISFAFYLVHGPVIWTLGDRLYAAVGWYKEIHEVMIPNWVNAFPLSHGGPLGLEPAFLLPHLIMLPLTFWIAEVVTRICDEPSVRISQWLYRSSLAPPSQGLELRS